MSKLRDQFMVNDRLREYIERMLSVIIENNPQLLEVATNIDMPILIASTNNRKPSLTTTTNEKVEPVPSPPSSEPVKSNDKYCRL
jgi:Holliday junction resolvasome RuvABC ATP-dependent DNA helicase subunit